MTTPEKCGIAQDRAARISRATSSFSAVESLPACPQDLREPLECPIEFFPGDNERRSNADDVIVSLLAQDSFVFQGFAIRASRALEFDTDPQAFSTNLFDGSTAERLKPREEVSSQFCGPLDHLLFNQDAQGSVLGLKLL